MAQKVKLGRKGVRKSQKNTKQAALNVFSLADEDREGINKARKEATKYDDGGCL